MLSDAPFFAYAIVDPRYFETLDRYQPTGEYRDIVEPLLDDSWSRIVKGFWTNYRPKDTPAIRHGWKIHVSAALDQATTTLRRAIPRIVQARIPFKLCSDRRMLNLSLGKNWSQSQAGKFIVVYPRSNEQFLRMLDELHAVTSDLEGPYILTDRPYTNSKVVFYRYGEHEGDATCTERGLVRKGFYLPDGTWWSDDRRPYFNLPPGIDNPVDAGGSDAPVGPEDAVALKDGRYRVKRPFKFNGVGGVYLADDTHDGSEVVIREARPFLGPLGKDDSFGLMRKEARILQRVAPTGYFARFIDLFEEWNHLFLVQERIQGQSLWGYAINFYYTGGFTPQDSFNALVPFLRKLVEALACVHANGVILRDLTRNNVMVTDDDQIRFIDLEFAYELDGDEPPVHAFTAGYASPEQLRNETPATADDCYALGALFLDIITFTASGHPLNRRGIIQSFRRALADIRLPSGIADIVEGLTHIERDKRWTLAQADARLRELEAPSDTTTLFPLTHRHDAITDDLQWNVEATLQGISTFLQQKADWERTDRLWPASSEVFMTNPLNVQYGAAGPALFLLRHQGRPPVRVLEWMRRSYETGRRPIPPSLYAGLAGVAWLFAECGDHQYASRLMEDAGRDEALALRVPGLFYGIAGWGTANLRCWQLTNDPRFLENAVTAGIALESRALRQGQLAYWETDGVTYLGYGEGQSGVAVFLSYLGAACGDERFTRLACDAIDFDWSMRQEVGLKDRLLWYPRVDSGPFHPNSPHMWFGTAGVGTALVRCYRASGRDEYLERARWCARSVANRFTNKIWQMYGLSGFGELMLDMYQLTGERDYLDNAYYHAAALLEFAVADGDGVAFPGDRLFRICSDFGMGTSGAGVFLHRLLKPETPRAWCADELLASSAQPPAMQAILASQA